jgi:hypothetical protein
VPTFVDRGVLRGQRGGSPMVMIQQIESRVKQGLQYANMDKEEAHYTLSSE